MRYCTLASGSSGNSLYIDTGETSVLVDAGLSGRAIEERMNAIGQSCKELAGILVTHEHSDHIKGVGVLARRFNLPVFTTEETWGELQLCVGPIPEEDIVLFKPGSVFEIGDLKVDTFSLSHDATDPVGFSFYDRHHKMSLVTDTGCMTSEIYKKIQDSDCYIIEANHDIDLLQRGSYPRHLKKRILSKQGHLSNVVAGHSLSSLVSGKTKSITLAHLSNENNNPEIAFKTVAEILAMNDIIEGENFMLQVAPRNIPGDMWAEDSHF